MHVVALGVMMQHGPITVIVNPDVLRSLLSLMEEYADMLLVLRMTKLSAKKLTKLTFFLKDYFSSDRASSPSICDCSTLNDVIDFLQNGLKIWLFNVDTLNAIKKKINNSEVTSSIEQYRQHLKEFLSSTSVKKFKDALEVHINDPSHTFESIILKLDEVRTNDTLQNLKKLVYDIFGVSSRAFIHIRTGIGCVCITWLVPTSLVSTIRAMAEQRSEEYLANLGVLELVIGLRVAPNEQSRFTSVDSYRKMFGAANQQIQNLEEKIKELVNKLKAKEKLDYKKCEQQEAELKAVLKEKSDYEDKCEQQEAELKAVLKEKSEYEDKCEQQEAELKAVLKEMSEYEEKCERQEVEAKEVEKQILKTFQREKVLVLQEESKDHIDDMKAGSSVTNIELDIVTFDGELHFICNYEAFMC